MKIINTGSTYRIYGDDLQTFDRLPVGTYKIDFNMMSGFSLEQIDNFQTIEEKIYGDHLEKIEKVLSSYDRLNRSLGIILSGNKGMGKSLFVQLLSIAAIEKGLPVIIASKPYKGIADFIDSIDQECLVMFDEFEKVFSVQGEGGESQNDLLGLFDGTSQKKRLYAVTVNKIHMVSEYMMSRPGRFHYHLRFDYPTAAEIEIYLKDKLEQQYYGEISRVISFANRVKLNYDSLRAIAFELNGGLPFRSAIGDLNILTTDHQRYDVKILFTNGKSTDMKNQALNLFNESIRFDGYVEGGGYFAVSFDTVNIQEEMSHMFIAGEHVHAEVTDEDGDPVENKVEVASIIITHHKEAGVNYRLPY